MQTLLEANRLRITTSNYIEGEPLGLVVTVECECADDHHHDAEARAYYWTWHPPTEVRVAILAEWVRAMADQHFAAKDGKALPILDRMSMVARLVAVLAAPARCPKCQAIAEHDAKAVEQ
jgi:hypothetical protein